MGPKGNNCLVSIYTSPFAFIRCVKRSSSSARWLQRLWQYPVIYIYIYVHIMWNESG